MSCSHKSASHVLPSPPQHHLNVIKFRGHYCADNHDGTIIAVGGSHGHGHDDDDEDFEVATVQLPSNPSVGQSHKLVAAGAAIEVDGGCFDVCPGGSFVPLCSTLTLTFADNKIHKSCGCGCEGCGCPCGIWVADTQAAPQISAVVEDADDLTSEVDVADFASGDVFYSVATGSFYVLSNEFTGTPNGTTIIATNAGVGAFLQLPTLGQFWLAVMNNGGVTPLPPPAV